MNVNFKITIRTIVISVLIIVSSSFTRQIFNFVTYDLGLPKRLEGDVFKNKVLFNLNDEDKDAISKIYIKSYKGDYYLLRVRLDIGEKEEARWILLKCGWINYASIMIWAIFGITGLLLVYFLFRLRINFINLIFFFIVFAIGLLYAYTMNQHISERIHLILFGMIGFLFTYDNIKLPLHRLIIYTVFWGFFAASLDEMFQMFLPYRVGDIRDVIFGGVGSTWGCFVCISMKYNIKEIIGKFKRIDINCIELDMKNIINYNSPSEQDIMKIIELFPIISKLEFSLLAKVSSNFKFLDIFSSEELSSWHRRLNNKLGKLRLSYIYLKYNFLNRIPDDNWVDSSGNNGRTIKYFPDFQKKHFVNKFYYDYYYEIFYYHFFSAIDIIFHILNIKLNINTNNNDNNFKNIVLKRIKENNYNLFNIMNDFYYNDLIRKAEKIRNDLTHNFAPNEVCSGVKWEGISGNSPVSIGIGNYMTSNEILKNIEEIIILFVDLLDKISELLNN